MPLQASSAPDGKTAAKAKAQDLVLGRSGKWWQELGRIDMVKVAFWTFFEWDMILVIFSDI